MNQETWCTNLKVGDFVDCMDMDNKWFEAVIERKDGNVCKVHFLGWHSRFDLNINIFSIRLKPHHTMTPKWREYIDIGDVIEILEIQELGDRKWFYANIIDLNRIEGTVTVSFGHSNHARTKTTELYGEEIAFLGTHRCMTQVVTLNKNTLKLIADKQFEHWEKRVSCTNVTVELIDNQCCVCLMYLKSVVLLPCKHLCVCINCSTHPSLTFCPLCKTVITSKLNVFV